MGFKTEKEREKWDMIVKGEFFRGVIILLQETKIMEEDVEYFKFLCDKEGWDVYTSCNISRCRGVAIIEAKKYKMKLVEKDTGGRKIMIQCGEEGEDMFITSIYAPVEHKERREWLSKLKVPKGRGVVGGDWNIATNKRDRSGDIRPKKVEKFQDWMEDYGMFDVTANLEHTFFSSKYTALLDRILVSTEVTEEKAYNGNSDFSDHRPVAVEWGGKKGYIWRLNPSILSDSWAEGVQGVMADTWCVNQDKSADVQ